ncbi:MAG TPA: Stk1 family PASTA domain-containing Ser/Thr kinase [Oscillospiraceae bacterium]|nr:Stk1 family PASTA domain-containing Ser/Thr kinase [Oscillospiraceae bacterium]HPK35463.1 Stk1 family PASTA domain-containing Ser/Thr kinase [Oscillospiraceae bacterium]HPR75187.1 Stk1 family PASTA domain-containing Ser/Thr kinase [Oscillospiraceae bacterium]
MGQFERYLGKKLDGRYELREIIGIGGMAVVYSAFDLEQNRKVAVKLLKEEYLANDEFRRRFKTESKAISVLSHPNIVKVYDVCLGDRLQYIVMELVEGITLKEFIELQKILSWKDSILFVSQILSALVHAHENGIVHRDIKPQNILLTSSGTIKVTDFGIAQFMRQNAADAGRTIGSVHYMSPEQARGDKVDARADLYAVGILLYEMLTGRLPFDSENPAQVAVMQMNAAMIAPRKLNPDIPVGLEEIIAKAMRKNPAERYQSAAEMLAALEKFKHNPGIVFAYKYTPAIQKPASAPVQKPVKAAKPVKEGKLRRIKSRWLGILFGITLSVMLGTGLFVFSAVLLKTTLLTPAGAEVDLPNFVGQNYYDIISNENYAKFNIEYDDSSQYNDQYAKDVIYEQTPTPPKKVIEGSTITVKVSKGPNLVTISDFSGREKTAVISSLEALGLFPKVVEKFSTETAPGYVLSTDPAVGTEVQLGTTVTVYVAINTESKAVLIPESIKNLTLNEAKRILIEKGLQVGTVTYAASAMEKDLVMETTPNTGEYVALGTVVDIVVSDGSYYFDETQTMDVMLTNLPQRSFAYLVEVYYKTDEPPIASIVISPGSTTVVFTVEIADGTQLFKVNANGQLLREILVDFDMLDYQIYGVDYAVDLSPGYLSTNSEENQ